MQAVLKNEVIKGMTPEMVAWAMGWPSIYGSAQELKKISQWTYDSVPPSTVDLYFEKGRLVRQESPNMP